MATSYYYAWVAVYGYELDSDEDIRTHRLIEIPAEIIFAINILVNFVTEFTDLGPDGETKPIRTFSRISENYLHNDFWGDFITTLPLYPLLFRVHEDLKLLCIIKIYRLRSGVKVFDV